MAIFRQHMVTRLTTSVVVLGAFIVPAFIEFPEQLPKTALGSKFILYVQYVAIILLAGILLLTIVIRGIWRGEVPLGVTKDGLTWPETVTQVASEGIAGLQEQIDSLEKDLGELAERVVLKPLP